jgi:hypothetical protein
MPSLRFFIFAAILTASVAAYAPAQETCALREAPELAGFRLGMSPAAVRKSLADTSMFDNKISTKSTTGASAVNVSAAELNEKAGDGIETVYLSFVDDKLAHIKVTYNGAGQWDGLQDFFARESAKLGLPKPAGERSFEGSGGNEKYIVKCGAFNAVLAYAFGVSPNIAVSDTAARTLVDRRREKEETGVQQTKIRSLPRPGPQRNPIPPQTGEPGPRKEPPPPMQGEPNTGEPN